MEFKTVLVADDNENNRLLYSLFLAHCGYRVVEASNGSEAVSRAREEHPDVILMDISMPLMDGLTATELLKADRVTHEIPILVVSAHDQLEVRRQARASGCDGFISKPAPPTFVLREIERLTAAADRETALDQVVDRPGHPGSLRPPA